MSGARGRAVASVLGGMLVAVLVAVSVAVLVAVSVVRPARAHDFRPGVLVLTERGPGSFAIAWTEPVDTRTPEGALRVVYPEGCQVEGATLSCAPGALEGEIAFRGPLDRRSRIFVTLSTRDGEAREAVATGEAPRVRLEGSPSWTRWVAIGIEHIALGLDHVAFVLGLVLLVGFERRIALTITAFTLAHSVTLALSVLDVLRLSAAPVEATIAASVVLVAREALHPEGAPPTLTRRAPWAVAVIFGLVHGLGFAGALREVGLPEQGLLPALVGFNVGVELGQLALVGLAWMGLAAARRAPRLEPAQPWARAVSCYALGALGAAWLIERTLAIVLR